MKKILFVAVAALVLAGCKGKSAQEGSKTDSTATEVEATQGAEAAELSPEAEQAKQQLLTFFAGCNEAINNATSVEEATAIGQQMVDGMDQIKAQIGEEVSKELDTDADLKAAGEETGKLLNQKMEELQAAATGE